MKSLFNLVSEAQSPKLGLMLKVSPDANHVGSENSTLAWVVPNTKYVCPPAQNAPTHQTHAKQAKLGRLLLAESLNTTYIGIFSLMSFSYSH